MDVQRYISSGIIENHIAGLLSEPESREVVSAMQQYPEVGAAADAVQQDMEYYIQLWAHKPPAGIKRQLMERLRTADVAEAPAATAAPETVKEKTVKEKAVGQKAVKEKETYDNPFPEDIKEGASPLRIWQYSTAAAVLLLLGSVTMNVISYGDSVGARQENASLQSEQAALNTEKDALKEQLESVHKEMAIMKDPSFKWTRMPAVGKHTGIVATVGWNPQSKETFILAQALPEPPADKQYQLWAIVNGKPIDAGVFELGDKAHSIQKVKPVDNAQVFAVTLEKKGGSPSPTLDQMFVAGKVSG